MGPVPNPFIDPNSNIYRNYQRRGEKANISPNDGAPYRRRFVLNALVLAGIVVVLALAGLYFLFK